MGQGLETDSLAPHWQGPYTVVLTTAMAVKVAGVTPLIHHMRVKTAYHTDLENTEWTAQKDPTDPCEIKNILKKKKKDHLEIEEKEMKLYNELLRTLQRTFWYHLETSHSFCKGQCFHFMGTFLC